MYLEVKEIKKTADSSLSEIRIDGAFKCFILEDGEREEKIHGETRIPRGEYEIKFRSVGGHHEKYLKKFGSDFHKGMLELQDAPNFKYILIHIGNYIKDTDGCLLVGESYSLTNSNYAVWNSRNTYKEIYPIIRDALLNNEKVTIKLI